MKTRCWRWARDCVQAITLVLLLAAGSVAWGQPALLLDAAAGSVALGAHGESWRDEKGSADVAALDAGTAGHWRPTAAGRVDPLRSGEALWFRFTISERDAEDRWYLEIPYPAVDRVTLYTQAGPGQWTAQSAGDTLPVAGWPMPHRHPLLPLALTPGVEQRFYLRVESRNGFSAPLLFTSEHELVRTEQGSGLVLGSFFGLAGLAFVLALVAAASLRDRAFGWFALTILLMTLTQASSTGVAGLHLWPHLAWWNDASSVALPAVTLAALLSFLSSVVSLAERSRRSHLLMELLSLACVAAAAVILVVETSWRTRVLVPLVLLALFAGVSVVVWAVSRGDRLAVWLLAALVPVAVGSTLPLARLAGLLPVNFWTANAMQLAIAVELPLLMAVLVARSQDRREIGRRIQGLQRTDPATGLINAQVFMERLQRLIARSSRLKHESVVLLVDIANAQALRRDFEPRWADELPLRVAGRLLSAARDIDSVARLDDQRFGMLVEGPLTDQEAAAAGARVVARCLMPFKDRPVDWVAQVRVAQAMVPGGLDGEQLLERLDAVLAAVPADSKRAVFAVR